MRAKATIRLKFPSTKQLKAVMASLLPEVDKPGFSRARVKFGSEGFFLVLDVEADDTVALRSTLNAYLRWVNSILNVVDVIEPSS